MFEQKEKNCGNMISCTYNLCFHKEIKLWGYKYYRKYVFTMRNGFVKPSVLGYY